MAFNRNDVWRIKRSAQQLNKALDSLTRANGELRPKQFADLRKHVDHAINVTETVLAEMDKVTEAAIKSPQKGLDLNLDDDEQAEAAE